MKKIEAKRRASTAMFCGIIIGGAYGAVLTTQFIEESDRRRMKEAAVAHRQYELSRSVEMLGNASLALAEKVGMSEDELSSRTQEIWNLRIEEAIHGQKA